MFIVVLGDDSRIPGVLVESRVLPPLPRPVKVVPQKRDMSP